MLMKCIKFSTFLLTCLLICQTAVPSTAARPIPFRSSDSTDFDRLPLIRDYAGQVIEEWKIPGMSVSVVLGDSVIFAEGFGVKEKGRSIEKDGNNVAITSRTIFHIGSMTKAFTATMIQSIVDEGLLSWDDRICEIMPDFEWYDDSVGKTLKLKDMLTHRTGLAAQAGTYIPNLGYNREDIYRMFKYIPPKYAAGEKFAYNNITFLIAARAVEKVTGKSWEENIQERILTPLGMTASSPNTAGYVAAVDNASMAHYFGHKKNRNGSQGSIVTSTLRGEERALHWVDIVGPAGSICSNAEDMAKWVRFHLQDGCITRIVAPDERNAKRYLYDSIAQSTYFPELPSVGNFKTYPYPDHIRLISKDGMQFLHTGADTVRRDSTSVTEYGYCWYIETNSRYKVIYHTGTTWGFTGICGFVPELDLGFAILCNAEVSEYARKGMMRRIIDLYMPDADTAVLKDWSGDGLKQWFLDRQKPRTRAIPCTIKRSSTVPDFNTLVGTYKKKTPFGDAQVSIRNGKLYLTIGRYGWTHRLDHYKGNEFHLRSDGHTFPIFFHNYEASSTLPVDFEIDFNYNEEFGPWIKE